MKEHWKVKDDKLNDYLAICEKAANDDSFFENFKLHYMINLVIENCTCDSGLLYLNQIKKQLPGLLHFVDKFKTNDKYGNPKLCDYDGLIIAPTTLRYIKTLADLIYHFGSLDDLNIVEIGGGYGGQCKIIYDLFSPHDYAIFDLPEVSDLQQTFLGKYDLRPLFPYTVMELHDLIDLVIANFSWSEFDEELRAEYLEKVISKAEMGYLCLNYSTGQCIKELDQALAGKTIIKRHFWDVDKKGESIYIFY